jgi:hypothetical protein
MTRQRYVSTDIGFCDANSSAWRVESACQWFVVESACQWLNIAVAAMCFDEDAHVDFAKLPARKKNPRSIRT